jgi:hypothetical protein
MNYRPHSSVICEVASLANLVTIRFHFGCSIKDLYDYVLDRCISGYLFIEFARIVHFSLEFLFNIQFHADACAVYTTFLSRDSLNLQSTSCGRLETMASAPIIPSCTNYLDTSKSPLSRPCSESLIKQSSPGDLHCRPVECTPEGAQMASPRGFRSRALSKSRGTSCLNESPG